MGAVCAVVYLISLIVFIPFAFYKDIVAATSGGGNRDVVIEDQHIETGRYLHRFPHGKVCSPTALSFEIELIVLNGSSHRTYRVFCPCNPSSSLELEMICLIFAGGTKS